MLYVSNFSATVSLVRRISSFRSSTRSSSSNNDRQPLLPRQSSLSSSAATSQSPSTTASYTPSIAPQSQAGKKISVIATSESSLQPIEEELERDNPPFERAIDLLAVAAPHAISIDQTEVFEQLVNKYEKENGEHPLSTLPASVRQRVYGFCFSAHDGKKICLSPKFAVRAVFPDDYFISPWTVLDPVLGGLHAFRALRHDLMNYFWTSYHFHVTINVFSGPIFSPLSHVWLLSFLDRIQRLTIEVDLTRLGGSALKLAATFGHKNYKVENLVQGLFQKLVERPEMLTIAELNLMCRRYGGFRPQEEQLDFATVPYCPDDEVYLIEMMPKLRGILQRCRISGFPSGYTKLMLSAAFGDRVRAPEFIIPSDSAWPPVPIPVVEPLVITSYLPAMSAPVGLGLTLPHRRSFSDEITAPSVVPSLDLTLHHSLSFTEENASPSLFPSLGLTLHHSRSFSDEVEDEINRYGSLFDFDKPFAGDAMKKRQYNSDILPSREQKSLDVRASIISDGSTSLGSPVDASTPRESLAMGEILCTRTFSIAETYGSLSPPRSPETLNKLNETDPAFMLPVSAMKTLSQLEANEQDPAFIRAVPSKLSSQANTPSIASENIPMATKTTVTMIGSPALRSVSSMSARTYDSNVSIKRRYTSFMDKLRGRVNT